MTWWGRWLGGLHRRPATPVELDPLQQLTVRALARFGPLPYSRLAAEVTAMRPATPADLVRGLLRLEEAGLIERLPSGRPSSRPPTRPLPGPLRLLVPPFSAGRGEGLATGPHPPRPDRPPLPLAGEGLEVRGKHGEERRFRLTRRGRRIARYIPVEPRSVMQVSI